MTSPYLIIPSTILIAVLIYAASKKFLFSNKKNLNSIPGPWGVPFLGYFPFIGRRIHITLTKLWQKYGNVYKITVGSRVIVILNGYDTIKEAFAGKALDFAGRPDFYTYQVASRDALIGINDYSEQYRIAKKVLLKAFGNFHAEKRPELQQVAHRSVNELIEIVKNAKNEPFDPNPHMYPIICIIMGYVCWGEFFDINDERIKHILGNAHEFGTAMAFGVACDYFPCMRHFFNHKLKKLEELMATNKEYSCKLALQHVETYNGEQMRDITDFFHKVAEEIPVKNKEILNLRKTDLLSIPGGLFGAGFATIAITTKWAIILLAKYPDFQTKMQDELDTVVGRNRLADFDDIDSLPYTMSVIYEVYRYSSIAHIAFAHKTLSDTEIEGHHLPKGTTVVANFYSAHRDPKYFKNPYEFDPERFLDLDSGSLIRPLVEKVIPYGLGMRRCGGEIVAKLEIFTFISTLIQKCRILECPDYPLDLDDYKTTVALDPNPFKVIFRSRFNEW